MTRKLLPLTMAFFLLVSVVVLGEGFASSLSSFGASIEAGLAHADEDEWDEDEWEPDEDEDEDDEWEDDEDEDDEDEWGDDDDDRRRGRRRW